MFAFDNFCYASLFGGQSEIHIMVLVGGWTNPVEKYARQNGFIFPNFRGEHSKNIWVATT